MGDVKFYGATYSEALFYAALKVADIETALQSEKARADAAERDARRYRWLRANAVEGRMESRGPRPDFYLNCDEPESEWDAAIDAAIGATHD